jgi:hypothetical protein
MQFLVRVFAIEMFEKTQEFLVRVPVYTPAFDAALVNQKGGQQASRSMSCIGVGKSFGILGFHREHRLSPVKGLDLGLFIDADHQSIFRRVEVESNNSCLFFRKLRVRALSAPVLGLMGLK